MKRNILRLLLPFVISRQFSTAAAQSDINSTL